MIKVLFAEDSAVVRNGLVRILRAQPDIEVVGEAENGAIALDLLKGGLRPDVLLTDLNMPVMDGLTLLRNVIELDINLPAIILTMHADKAFIHKAINAGAKGYLLKDGEVDALFDCIRSVQQGKTIIGNELD